MICDTCIHAEICKWKEDYKAREYAHQQHLQEIADNDGNYIEPTSLKCKFYNTGIQTRKSIDVFMPKRRSIDVINPNRINSILP